MKPDQEAALDKLGMHLMSEVRDRTLAQMQRLISGKMRDDTSTELHREYVRIDPGCRAIVQRLIVYGSDLCLAQFLDYLEHHEVPIPMVLGPGKVIDARAASDGLVGELYTDRGWIERFSTFKDSIPEL